jgi:hypothetical protein
MWEQGGGGGIRMPKDHPTWGPYWKQFTAEHIAEITSTPV